MTHSSDKRKGTNRGTEDSEKQGTGSVAVPTLHGDSLVGSKIFSISFLWKWNKLEITTDWYNTVRVICQDRQSPNCQHQQISALVYLELKAENRQHTHTLQSTHVRVQPTVNTG